jgi:predicted ATP-dependent endonuclease of OLD family
MNNFRGFSDTLVPIVKATFLVGENSTGKSSFLKLLRLMSSSRFWAYPSFDVDDEWGLGSFQDIISASGVSKQNFQVGLINSTINKNGKTEIEFTVLSF